MPTKPLDHLQVLDLTDLRGALAGRMLADLGADVVKVEPAGGDPGRLTPPFAGGIVAPGGSLPYLFRNANKRSVTLDLEDGTDRARLHTLCDRADILIENAPPAVRAARDLAPEAVRTRHPQLVHVAIKDMGLGGPRAGWRLEPLAAFAASGALAASGLPDRPPCWLPGYLAHDCAAAVAVTGALAAILARARDGCGQTVEVSVQEAAITVLDPWSIPLVDYAERYTFLPRVLPRDGDGPALVVPTADGHVRLLAVTPRQLGALARLLADSPVPPRPGKQPPIPATTDHLRDVLSWLADGAAQAARLAVRGLAQLPLRAMSVPLLHGALAVVRTIATEALRHRPRDQVLAQGLALGLPIAPVHTPEEFVDAAQTRARAYFHPMRIPVVGEVPLAPFPARFDDQHASIRQSPAESGSDASSDPLPSSGAMAGAPPVEARPLAGVRVVNLGVGAVAPECCRVLAELGAEVVKIEPRRHPDFLRRLAPEPDAPNRSWMFNDTSRGHQSLCLDVEDPEGRALGLRLCAAADVVVENRQAGVVEAWGLGYHAVRTARPDVIYLSSQGYGRGGPLGTAPAYGPLVTAFVGATCLWNHADAPYPCGSSLEHPDHAAGWLAAVAILAALEYRRRTGCGKHIELAQSEAAAFLMGEHYLQAPSTGRPARPDGNASLSACPHGVYPAAGADRWVTIAVAGDDAWERFRVCLGWAAEPRWATLPGRLGARDKLDERVAAWTRMHSAEDAAATLQAAGVSAMPVMTAEELRTDPHLAARDALVEVDDPEIGSVRHAATPVRLSRTPAHSAGPAPRLGADTATVLERVLGLHHDEVARLMARGVVG
jgi:crotonobetainyl-CoA:carnitine CoA-transferase CaiB-like acyl-CoA transferase